MTSIQVPAKDTSIGVGRNISDGLNFYRSADADTTRNPSMAFKGVRMYVCTIQRTGPYVLSMGTNVIE